MDLGVDGQGALVGPARPVQIVHPHRQVAQRLQRVGFAPWIGKRTAGLQSKPGSKLPLHDPVASQEDQGQMGCKHAGWRCFFVRIPGAGWPARIQTSQHIFGFQCQQTERCQGLIGSHHSIERRAELGIVTGRAQRQLLAVLCAEQAFSVRCDKRRRGKVFNFVHCAWFASQGFRRGCHQHLSLDQGSP